MSQPLAEYDAIARALQHYIEGGRTGSSETMKLGFASTASIYGYLAPDLIAGPIQDLYDWVDANPPANGRVDRIAGIDVHESFASVRVEVENWAGHRFTDVLSLLKMDGEWKIVSKTFHLHAD